MPKHIPQRTCIACRTVRGKRELVRIVHTEANRVEADATGKKAGRGAYLCRQRECWDQVLSNLAAEIRVSLDYFEARGLLSAVDDFLCAGVCFDFVFLITGVLINSCRRLKSRLAG